MEYRPYMKLELRRMISINLCRINNYKMLDKASFLKLISSVNGSDQTKFLDINAMTNNLSVFNSSFIYLEKTKLLNKETIQKLSQQMAQIWYIVRIFNHLDQHLQLFTAGSSYRI